jgi:hypothetical protein
LKNADELQLPPPPEAAPGGGASFSCGDNPPLLVLLLLVAAALPLPERFRLCGKGGNSSRNTTLSRSKLCVPGTNLFPPLQPRASQTTRVEGT